MKKLSAGFLLAIVTVFISCGKNDSSGCQPVSVDAEKPQMVSFCTSANINYTINSSGLLYQIIDPGTGTVTPTSSSTVSVLYVGKFLSGFTFDSSVNVYTATLNNFIDGWKIGIPLIKKGAGSNWSCLLRLPIAVPGTSPPSRLIHPCILMLL